MVIFMRFWLAFVFFIIVFKATLAFSKSPSDGFHGYFYNPAWHGGCYEDGVVFHVDRDRIMLFAHGDQGDYIEDLKITNLPDKFIIEGAPSTRATVETGMKKVVITYKSLDTGYMPVAMTIDNNILDVQKADARAILENGYSLQRCDSPSFMGWLLITIGWHTAFEPTSDQ